MPRAIERSARSHGLTLGAASGVLFGVSDVALKALLGLVDLNDPLRLASPWALIAIVASVSAFYASARGLQDGDAVSVIAITGTAANIVGILGGIVVFGDPMPGDTVGLVLQVVAFVLVIVAAALTPPRFAPRAWKTLVAVLRYTRRLHWARARDRRRVAGPGACIAGLVNVDASHWSFAHVTRRTVTVLPRPVEAGR